MFITHSLTHSRLFLPLNEKKEGRREENEGRKGKRREEKERIEEGALRYFIHIFENGRWEMGDGSCDR